MPHIVRTGLAECLGVEEGRVRIISPDVGGGFGYKAILLAEEICLGWLALRRRHPVRWLEDRREHLTAKANCREHHYEITVYAERDGRYEASTARLSSILGYLFGLSFLRLSRAAWGARILPGPYADFPAYRCRAWSVATNKCPVLPYRGVARTGVCFALELALDAVAAAAGLPPETVRFWRSLVSTPSRCRSTTATEVLRAAAIYPAGADARLADDRRRCGPRPPGTRRARTGCRIGFGLKI